MVGIGDLSIGASDLKDSNLFFHPYDFWSARITDLHWRRCRGGQENRRERRDKYSCISRLIVPLWERTQSVEIVWRRRRGFTKRCQRAGASRHVLVEPLRHPSRPIGVCVHQQRTRLLLTSYASIPCLSLLTQRAPTDTERMR